jgi:hypothetical protein
MRKLMLATVAAVALIAGPMGAGASEVRGEATAFRYLKGQGWLFTDGSIRSTDEQTGDVIIRFSNGFWEFHRAVHDTRGAIMGYTVYDGTYMQTCLKGSAGYVCENPQRYQRGHSGDYTLELWLEVVEAHNR